RLAPTSHELKVAPRLPVAMLIELIRGARLVISNGGDTMLQALACKRPCVAVAIAGDQAYRIKRCVRAGLVASARLDAADLERVALRMLETGDARESVAPRPAHAGAPAVNNGIETALAA